MIFFYKRPHYSVFLTIRKKYIKSLKPASKEELFEHESVIEDLKQENENLRNAAKEITIENEANKNKVAILEKRLENVILFRSQG